MNGNDQEQIKNHLAEQPEMINGMYAFTGFTAALRDARGATGRDPDTGARRNADGRCSWLGAVGYLILLDQIGKCFRPRGGGNVAGNSIFRALTYFSNLQDNDKIALYAFRCAFAHDYSLVNENPHTHQRTHHFVIAADANTPIVVHPCEAWDGNYENRTRDNATVINVAALGDQVEGICRELFRLAENDELDVLLAGGVDELVNRYAIAFRPPRQ